MKKNLLLLSLLVVPFGMSMTACDNGEQEHKVHVWEKGWTFDADNHWLKCSKCDATNFKSPHKYDDGTITTEATATTDGVKTYTCEVCGSTKTAAYSLGENGHSHVWSDAYTGDNDYHWLECISCHEAKVKEAHTWDNGAITSEPTQTEEGVKTYTCTVCKKTKTESVPSLGSGHTHEWSTAYASDDNDHWITCASCDQIKDKNAHNWGVGVVSTEPTETENGVRTYTCSICNKTKTEVIPKTGSGSGTGTGNETEVDGYVLVDSIKDTDNLYIVSSADGITYNAMTATIKDATLPWYFNYAVTDYDLTKDGISSMEEGAEQFKFVKQGDGSYIIQTKNGLYLYSYIEGTHYSIGLCNTTAADKGGTVYWNITKKDNGFIIKGTTTNVYLEQYQSFCGNKNESSWPIYLFQPGKVTVTTGGGSGSNDDYTGTLAEDSRWNLDFTQYGYTFRDTLSTLIRAKVTKTTSYSACLSVGQGAAAKGSGYVPFYHNEEHSKSESANREHTWPNSRGGGSKAGGSEIEEDPYMVRPTLTKDNSDRGNYFYGIGSSQWDPASCGFEGARGESARVIFYVATKYGKSHGLSLSNNPGDSASKKTMGTLKYLVEWNRKYPVTDMEKQINNNLEKAGFGRNPFVDHPEYAEFIWTTNGVQTSVPNIDVGGTGTGGGTGGSTGGATGGGTTNENPAYTLKSELQDVDNAYIVSTANGSSYKAGTATEKDKYSWYLNVVDATVSSDKASCSSIGQGADEFKFTKQSDGTYTIQSSGGKYIYNYVEDTHHSIGLCDTTSAPKSGTIYWTLTKSGEGFVIKSATLQVYLTISDRDSVCGSSSAPSYPIYLYGKAGSSTGGSTGGGTGGSTGGNTGGSTGGNTGGGTTEDNSKFVKVTSLDVLENALIVSTADGSGFFSMTTAAKQADKPFYLAGVGSTLSSDKSECTPIGSNAEVFKFTKQSDGTYTIQSSDNKYLFGYIEKSGSKTYNSIQFTDSVTNTKINSNIQSSTAYWDITAQNDGYVVKAHGISVYLEYYDGRFCGYKSAPSTLIYFYSNPAEIINRD